MRHQRRWDGRLVACRIFTVTSAACLVGAFALAALAPVGISLGNALAMADPSLIGVLHRIVAHQAGQEFPASVWLRLVLPFLMRPVWIVPAMLGLIGAGLALTAGRPPVTKVRRR